MDLAVFVFRSGKPEDPLCCSSQNHQIQLSCSLDSDFIDNYKDPVEISQWQLTFLDISNDYKTKMNKVKALISKGYVLILVVFHIFSDPVSVSF